MHRCHGAQAIKPSGMVPRLPGADGVHDSPYGPRRIVADRLAKVPGQKRRPAARQRRKQAGTAGAGSAPSAISICRAARAPRRQTWVAATLAPAPKMIARWVLGAGRIAFKDAPDGGDGAVLATPQRLRPPGAEEPASAHGEYWDYRLLPSKFREYQVVRPWHAQEAITPCGCGRRRVDPILPSTASGAGEPAGFLLGKCRSAMRLQISSAASLM